MRMVIVYLPSILSKITNEKKINVDASNVKEVVVELINRFGDPLKEKLFEESGVLNRYLKFYRKGVLLDESNDMSIPLGETDEINILVIIGGG
jgi:molybdopterin converting factor small subunit